MVRLRRHELTGTRSIDASRFDGTLDEIHEYDVVLLGSRRGTP
jgi:hypothetical protein